MATTPLRVLLVEDSADDADLLLLDLGLGGFEPTALRVDTADRFRAVLATEPWDVILCDNALPEFDASQALGILRQLDAGVPLIVVSGTIGEERAVELMRAGAADYLMKGRLGRLAPAVEREVREAASRRALRQAEQEARDLAAIVAWSGDAIVRLTLDGTVRTFNGGAERLYGYAAADLAGRSVYTTLVPPEVRDEYQEMLGRVGRGERVEPWESERVRKDGTRVHVSVTLSPIRDDEGRVVGASSIARDITRRKQAEGAVQASEEFNRSLMDASADCIKVLDPDGRLLVMNGPGLCLMEVDDFGTLCGQAWERLWPADARAEIERAITTARGGKVYSFEAFCPTAKGTPRWWDVAVSPVRDTPEGPVVRLLVVSRDITERKFRERELADSHRHFEQTLNTVGDLFASFDRAWNYTYLNRKAAAFTGHEPEDLVGKNLWEAFPAAVGSAFHGELLAAAATGLFRQFEEYYPELGLWYEHRAYPHPQGLSLFSNDMTERKRIENALNLSEERLRLASEATGLGIYDWDLVSNTLNWDAQFSAIFGVKSTVVPTLELFYSLLHPHDVGLTETRIRRALDPRGDGVYRAEYRAVHTDGNFRWVTAIGRVTFDGVGGERRPIRFVGTVLDITEQKQAQAERDEALARLNLQIERMPLAYVLHDADFRYTGWNPAAERTFGFTRAEVLGKLPYEVIVPPQACALVADIFARLAAGDMDAHLTNENITRDGRTITCEWYNTPLYGPDGIFLGVLSLAQDVTARRQAEHALLLRDRAIRAVAGGILITDANAPDHPISYVSPGFTHLTGYTGAEAIGRNCRFLQGKDTDPAAVAELREAVRQGMHCDVELLNYLKDGTPFWNALSISPVHDEAGRLTHFIGVQTDVTGRRKLENQFHQAQKMEAVGQLAGGVAHDFNNLLTVINGYGEIVHDALPPDDPSRELVAEITKAGTRAAGLTRQLLAFSRQAVLAPKVLDPNALVRDVEKMLRRLIGEDIDLAAKLAPDLGRVKADPGQLEQAVVNLCVNARDAMPTGGKLTVETRNIELDATYVATHPGVRPGPYVVIAVSDTGTGMTPEVQARIFEPFFTTKGQGKGTGLGLAMVFGFVKQSGGHVGVHSEVSRGTTFKLYFPRVADAPLPGKSSILRTPMPRGTETVLLVEDEDVVRALGRHVLMMCGYTVLEAGNGREAVKAADGHAGPLHLLMTDVVMPGGMGGRQVAEAVVARHPGIKVLFSSGYTDDAVVRHGVLEEGTHFLQKPFTPATLAQKVRDVLDAGGDDSRVDGS